MLVWSRIALQLFEGASISNQQPAKRKHAKSVNRPRWLGQSQQACPSATEVAVHSATALSGQASSAPAEAAVPA